MLDFIVMQMRRVNREKGYYAHLTIPKMVMITQRNLNEDMSVPTGIEPMTSRTPAGGALSTEVRELMENKVI